MDNKKVCFSPLAITLLALLAEPAAAVTTAGAEGITPCPTTGTGAVVAANASCNNFTPASAGALSTGVNATYVNYALAPNSGASGYLTVFLNGSGGHPANVIPDGTGQTGDPATQNVYVSASAQGHHVLSLSYDSSDAIGLICNGVDSCFLPTRTAIVEGVPQQGAAPEVANITLTEGIYSRLALALSYLAQYKPEENWSQFLQPNINVETAPGDAVVWSKVIASGHSQGGGHAALLSKLRGVQRMVAFSSPCDKQTNGQPATWLTYNASSWVSNPANNGWGFAARTYFNKKGEPIAGDLICSDHLASLQAMTVAGDRTKDNADICGWWGDPSKIHSASIKCIINQPQWNNAFNLNDQKWRVQ
jgi:hypothetical protein